MEVDGAGASAPVEVRGCTGERTCEWTGTLTRELPPAGSLTWVTGTRMEATGTRVKQQVHVWR